MVRHEESKKDEVWGCCQIVYFITKLSFRTLWFCLDDHSAYVFRFHRIAVVVVVLDDVDVVQPGKGVSKILLDVPTLEHQS
jgi:hypothetical protein